LIHPLQLLGLHQKNDLNSSVYVFLSLGVSAIICAKHSFSLSPEKSISERMRISMDLYQKTRVFDSVGKALQRAFPEPSSVEELTDSADARRCTTDKLLSIIRDNTLSSDSMESAIRG